VSARLKRQQLRKVRWIRPKPADGIQ
jgi:hypothetical protein